MADIVGAGGDEANVHVSLARLDAATQQLIDVYQAEMEKAAATGERLLASEYQAKIEAARGQQAGGLRTPEQAQATTAALQGELATQREIVALDTRRVGVLREQAALITDMAAMQRELEAGTRPSGLIIPPSTGGRAFEQTLPGQLYAEQAAAMAQVEAAVAGAQARVEATLRPARVGGRPFSETIQEQLAALELLNQRTSAGSIVIPSVGVASKGQTAGGMAAAEAQLKLAENEAKAQAAARALSAALARLDAGLVAASQLGSVAAAEGRPVRAGAREALLAGPPGGGSPWSKAEREAVQYELTLSQVEGYTARTDMATRTLTADMTRLGIAQAEASNEMRRHGALTTEWLGALARGETTLSELGYQVGTTIGKFGGWAVAAAATYSVFGAFAEMAKGAIEGSNAVGMLNRTIEHLDTQAAASSIRRLSQDTNVSMQEAGDAVFQFSRTFHNLGDATAVAKDALQALGLDNVQLSDSVRAVTAIHQQFGISAQHMVGIYDMLASGQREYNARISDMIPLLLKASGAIANAGGDPTQLVQLGVVGVRSTQIGGSQVGTALYRSAATFVPKNAAQLVTQFGLGGDINALTGKGNVTQLIQDAIRKSATMPGPERRQLSNLIFGPQYGGRLAGLFGPHAAQLLQDVTQGPRAITPAATHGAQQQEFDRFLDTTRQKLHSFVVGLQDLGSALASSGVFTPFRLGLQAVVAFTHGITGLANIFDALPSSVRDVTLTMLGLRTMMLFFSRTRMGSSVPLITSIPGFRPSEATLARRELSIGGRAAINQLEAGVSETSTSLLVNKRQQAIAAQRRDNIRAQIASDRATQEELEQEVTLNEQIAALKRQQVELEGQNAAQQQLLKDFQERQTALTATTRRLRAPNAQVLAWQTESAGGTQAAEAEATNAEATRVGLGGYAVQRANVAKRRLAASLRGEATQTRAAAAVEGELATQQTANAVSAEALAVETTFAEAATVSATAAALTAREALAGMYARTAGLIGALDPFLIAVIALPMVWGALQDSANQQSQALDAARTAANTTITNLASLGKKGRELEQQGRKAGASPGFLEKIREGWGAVLGGDIGKWIEGSQPANRAKGDLQAARGAQELNLQLAYQRVAAQFQKDADTLGRTRAGRAELAQKMTSLRSIAETFARVDFGTDPVLRKDIAPAINAFMQDLKRIKDNVLAVQAAGDKAPDFTNLVMTGQLSPQQIQKQLQAWDDASKVFGTNNNALQKAAVGYAALVSKYGSTGEGAGSATLQAIYTAQQNLVQSVTKNVQDWLERASTASTAGGQQRDLDQALRQMTRARDDTRNAFGLIFKRDAGNLQKLALDHAAEDQILAQYTKEFASVVDAQLQLMQAESAASVSQIQGISPEADLAREQAAITGPNGLQDQLARAKAMGADAQKLAALQASLNNARLQYKKDQTSNARDIVDAQGQLLQAQVTGISPQDDITRATDAVTAAHRMLAFDQAHGAGAKQLLQDQVTLDNALHSLYSSLQQRDQQIEQDAQAFIQAQAAFAESQTVDPVAKARDALKADVQAIGTIRPQDYRTYQEYQTALLQAKAKANDDKVGVRQAIYQKDLDTIQFELSTQRISDAQAMAEYQQLLKMKDLNYQQRQQILQDIFNLSQQSAVDLNLGNIKMPTAYEVRSAILSARRRILGHKEPQTAGTFISQPTTITNHVTMNIMVAKDSQVGKVADATRKVLTQTRSVAQASGLI